MPCHHGQGWSGSGRRSNRHSLPCLIKFHVCPLCQVLCWEFWTQKEIKLGYFPQRLQSSKEFRRRTGDYNSLVKYADKSVLSRRIWLWLGGWKDFTKEVMPECGWKDKEELESWRREGCCSWRACQKREESTWSAVRFSGYRARLPRAWSRKHQDFHAEPLGAQSHCKGRT